MLACDGVWDVMSNQEVVQFVSVCLDSGMSLDSIASQLLDACLAPDPRETRGIGKLPDFFPKPICLAPQLLDASPCLLECLYLSIGVLLRIAKNCSVQAFTIVSRDLWQAISKTRNWVFSTVKQRDGLSG